ncbi:MAG TPA: hypothetical protein VGG91_14395 [Myxococcaceae bacterium]
MDFQTAWGVWQRRNGCAPDEPTDEAFVTAARSRPDLWSTVERACGKAHPPEDAQNALLALAARTASTVLGDDDRLSGPLERARGALESEGAMPDQIDALVGAVLLEEAFGDDMPADGFDAAFVAESLDTLAHLATLTPQRVAALELAFAGGPDGAERRNRRIAAQTLCGVAWSEGPDLVSREHLEAAAERLEPAQRIALAEFVDHLSEMRLIGPRRRVRLRRVLAEL